MLDRHCEEPSNEAIQSRAHRSGLLRCARNDETVETDQSSFGRQKIIRQI